MQELNSAGLATFLVDSFAGRGIGTTVNDQSQLSSFAMMIDAYRALSILRQHPRIDPNRISIIGFSKGAVAAVYSAVERFRKMYAPGDATFAAHIGLYTPCQTTYRDDDKVSSKAIPLVPRHCGRLDFYRPLSRTTGGGRTEAAAPPESRAMLRPYGVGATGFEPATTCTPSGAGSRATITGSSQRCGILRTSTRPSRPRIPRIHHVSQKFCYQFATADRAAPRRPPGSAASRRLLRHRLQVGRRRRAAARPYRECRPRSA